MMGPVLIFGGNKASRKNYIEDVLIDLKIFDKKYEADLLIIENTEDNSKTENIGIDRSREITSFLSIRPFVADKKVVVIYEAHNLTPQAQNALLKTLEEPPEYASLILSTDTENDLLETVVSRCRRIKLEATLLVQENELITFAEFISGDVGQRLEYSEKLAKESRSNIVYLVDLWIIEARKLGKLYETEHLINFKNDLTKTNVNLKLGLETLSLNC